MRKLSLLCSIVVISLFQCKQKQTIEMEKGQTEEIQDYSEISSVAISKESAVMLTSYSTTLLADGKDHTEMKVSIIDSLSRQITTAEDSVQIYVSGKGFVKNSEGLDLAVGIDSSGTPFSKAKLENGLLHLKFITDTLPDKVKIEIRSTGLYPASHEIHTISKDFDYQAPTVDLLPETTKSIDNMIGADISFLSQLEERGMTFSENGETMDAIELLKKHGINYIRLRIFVNPENEKGYSPNKGYCDLDHTVAMAKRIKAAGLKFLLDFHYSDYWADPQQQYKPLAWEDLSFEELQKEVTSYTADVLTTLKSEGVFPDMIQVGNEINHGMIWPDGYISNPDGLASLLKAGVAGVEQVDKQVPIMMHIALGGQNKEAVFWLDNMLARGVKFDIIGLSYYPRWHGSLNDLNNNLRDLIVRYHKPVNVVEYSEFKKPVHDIVFSLPNDMGKGAAVWEPLNWRTDVFDEEGNATKNIEVYDDVSKNYLKP